MTVAGAAGIAAATAKVLPGNAQNDGVVCQMAVQALTSAGPSSGQAYSGVLEITISAGGAIDSGSFTPDGGISAPVVGETEGRALDLRLTFADGQALVLTGTGEYPIDTCSGALSGGFSGPRLGDTGSWVIDPAGTVLIDAGRPDAIETATPAATATPSVIPTVNPECAAVSCEDTYVMDPVTCECLCPEHYDACGPVCCPGGSICLDESSGECTCPDGTELCGDWCVESCPAGEYLNDSCTCVEGCDLICDNGEQLDWDACECNSLCSAPTPNYCHGDCYAEPRYECSGVCYTAVELNSNSQMCGIACTVCPAGVPCIAGSCQCPATYDYCPGAGCKSLSDDNDNCGSCGTVCTGGKTCQGGMCQL